MLVLSRKIGQRILVGESITVTVCGMNADGTVRIGIDAPGLRVDREEVRLQKPPAPKEDDEFSEGIR